jgi:dihydroxyacetone kinase
MLNPGLALMEAHNVIIRADAKTPAAMNEVALISGGGAGHEPAHAGYVGPGMLTAAVAGDVFTSPSTDAVLAAIRAVARPAGVLLIVKNYTGDRLNFGLAAEIARTEGIAVEMVVVADDIALDAKGDHAGRRGIAGTVLVHKVAGAAAAAGQPLHTVKAAALRAIQNVGSMGVGLTACTVPAAGAPGFQLGDNEIELGLGIHGEAGVRRTSMAPATQLAQQLVGAITQALSLTPGDRVALLVNNLGGTPTIELQLFAGNALEALAQHGLRVERAWSGSFLTALDMAGVSLSLLKLNDDDDLSLLDAPTQASAWPAPWQGKVLNNPQLVLAPAGSEPVEIGTSATPDTPLVRAIEAICSALISAESELTRLDQAVGDGDLGISLSRGARAVRQEINRYPLADTVGTLRALSATLRRALGGTSGPLYAIMLMRAAAAFENATASTRLSAWSQALQAGCNGIAEIGGATEGDCTMLDALLPAARALAQTAPDADIHRSLQLALAAAKAGCESTADVVAKRGRSSYLGDRALGHVDPGALAVCLWLEALTAQFARP